MNSSFVRRAVILFSLILAGELVFSLPFHVARFFRPTFLEVFGLTNAKLGDVFAIYGVIAMLSYLFGGVIADRFSSRTLLTISLWSTAFGGIYFATIPGSQGLTLLFAYWGLTSILLFWSALIKSTKEWGAMQTQGRAFGMLDGGRGLVAATVATLAIFIVQFYMPIELDSADSAQRRLALQQIIYFYTLMTMVAGVFVWLVLPTSDTQQSSNFKIYVAELPRKMREPAVLLQAVIVVCAYCGYKGLDNYGLYVIAALEMNQIESAEFMTMMAYLRPIAAIGAGYIVDRTSAIKIIIYLFLLTLLSYVFLMLVGVEAGGAWIIVLNIVFTFFAVYALRGVYFALLQEVNTPSSYTGATVGIISFIGFTPDIFFASITGRILDTWTGIEGFQFYFGFLAVFMLIGAFAGIVLRKFYSNR